MQIGAIAGFGGGTSPEYIAHLGRVAEAAGIQSLWMPEHVVLFAEHDSRYPYSADGRIPGNPAGVLEPLTALAYLAAHTSRIRLGTGICLVPQRSPVYTAKQVADVDFLSQGRVDFGVGIGWLREEFDALGVPWERRAQRTRDYIGVIKALWCEDVSRYESEFYTLPACQLHPKPVQRPHPPIFFGGESEPALRRVAELGQGWFGFSVTPEELAGHLERLDLALQRAGRTRSDVRVYVSPRGRPRDPSDAKRFADLGVDQLILPLAARSADEVERRAEALASLA